METKNEMDELIYSSMSAEQFTAPDITLVAAARKKVLARKHTAPMEKLGFFDRLFGWMNLQVKLYHLGVSAVLAFAGYLYLNEKNYSDSVGAGLTGYHAEMSIHNTTVSVNSSTMLTSIPTLIIRN